MPARRARPWWFTLVTVLALASAAIGQVHPDFLPPDTTFAPRERSGFRPFFPGPTPQFLLTPSSDELDFSNFLRQSLFPAGRPGGASDQNFATLQWIWRDEVVRGGRYRTLTEIVGAVELGAVGYLAYRHLKRYGLK